MLVYVIWFGVVEKKIKPASPTSASFQQQPRQAPAVNAAPGADAAAPQAAPASVADRKQLETQSLPAALGKAQVKIHPKGAAVVSWQYQEPLGTVELVRDPQPGFLAAFPELAFSPAKDSPLTWTARRADGLQVVKQFMPAPDDRTLPRVVITLKNAGVKPLETGPWSLSIGPGLGTIGSETAENVKQMRAIGLTPADRGLAGAVEIFKPGQLQAPYRWVAVDNRYFLAALLPQAGDFSSITCEPGARLRLDAAAAHLAPGQSRAWAIPYYIGEKGNTWLSRYGVGLERSIDFGFFAQLGRFVLKALDKLHALTGNWGWSIIVLTMLLQILLLPLTYKSLKAQAAMRRLQPEIARLQQRHAKDPKTLNAETMELYRKHGANPLGGCLPMLIQMPVFIALYNALRNAWELHGAGWIFWIHDLSAKDPYYILPLVMGGLMFAQNKLNPPTSDPTQQQMMKWMPIIFTFMFLKFPAGLVLYWLTNSAANAAIQMSLRSRFDSTAGRK